MKKLKLFCTIYTASGDLPLNFEEDVPLNYSSTSELSYKEPLQINVVIMKPDNLNHGFCLINVDIVWIPTQLANIIRENISLKWKFPTAFISVTATHTHGTPNFESHFRFKAGSTQNMKILEANIYDVVDHAFESQAHRARFDIIMSKVRDVSVNRRRMALFFKKGWPSVRVQNLPNRRKSANNRLTAIELKCLSSETTIARIINFACHPVSDPPSTVGADFPGHIRKMLNSEEKALIPTIFLQGFAGDIRPNLIRQPKGLKDWILQFLVGPRFRASKDGDAQLIAKQVVHAIKHPDSHFSIFERQGHYSASRRELKVYTEAGTTLHFPLDFTRWSIGILDFKFLSGEILSGFSNTAKPPKINIEVGYANGMVGYIPTSKDFRGGGYEVDGSRTKFNIKSRIKYKFSALLEHEINL